MCPKPFSWAKNKRELFSDGKLRGPLLVALKYHTYLALGSSLVVNAKVSSTQSRTFFSERSWWKIDVTLSFYYFSFFTDQTELLAQLNALPVRVDTLRVKTAKADLERKLAEIEDAIKIFSRPKVFVKVDD